MRQVTRAVLTYAATLVLVACGGGSGSGTSSTNPQSTVQTPQQTTSEPSTPAGLTTSSTNAIYLANDTLIFDDYYLKTPYTLAQFQSQPGITVKWPMYDAAAIRFTLTDAGSFNVAAGQTLSAAVSISDTAPGSQGIIKLYIDNVAVTRDGSNITFTVPNQAVAWVYGLAVDGTGAELKNFSTTVSNATSTLSITPNISSSIELGRTINSALNSVGSPGNGTYKVTLVLTNLPLSQANGTAFKSFTIEIPKSLGDMSNVRSITGLGLEGFITLTPW